MDPTSSITFRFFSAITRLVEFFLVTDEINSVPSGKYVGLISKGRNGQI